MAESARLTRERPPYHTPLPPQYRWPIFAGRASKQYGVGGHLRECYQQRPGLLEVNGVKALSQPAIDLGQELMGLGALTLLLPQAREARGGPQFQRLGLLAASNVQGSP